MSAGLKVLIIGGYGIFGGRIVELLEDEPRLTFVRCAAARSRKADEIRARRSKADCGKACAPSHFRSRRRRRANSWPISSADIVVDASGPFQAYGDDRYRVVEACIASGINYLDLADGSDFVAGIGAFDAQRESRRIYVLSGVSSFPVLTAAVGAPARRAA